MLGSGGREHAIGWKLAQSPSLGRLISAPGNPGLAGLGPTISLDAADPDAVTAAATSQAVDLVVVGPEAPLAAGVVDALRRASIPVFGPVRAAARLETSKRFAKEIMHRAGIPTGASQAFLDRRPALDYLAAIPGPYVVKADGLAAGKGVLVTPDLAEAQAWVDSCFAGRFGEAGNAVVIEEYLQGEEISVFGLSDGEHVIGLRPARDYKLLRDGNRGPNTGGMGAFAPVTGFGEEWVAGVVEEFIVPVLASLAASGSPYVGFIYAGLILTADGPKVLEFNCRLGDPEAQALLPLMESDLLELIVTCVEGGAESVQATWSNRSAVNVVLAAKGYPEGPVSGDDISGLEQAMDGTLVFHAGTRVAAGAVKTAGGRVLNVVGLGPDLATARQRAYARVATIDFAGKHYRKDITE